jgi:hypothetical protein
MRRSIRVDATANDKGAVLAPFSWIGDDGTESFIQSLILLQDVVRLSDRTLNKLYIKDGLDEHLIRV